jgi:hypothetical protein
MIFFLDFFFRFCVGVSFDGSMVSAAPNRQVLMLLYFTFLSTVKLLGDL